MPNEAPEDFRPRLPAGARIGRCTVAAFLGREALGERYAVQYGSTKHLLDLIVPSDVPGAPTLDDYRAHIRRTEPVARHPALVHCFVAGIDPCLPPVRPTSVSDFDYGDFDAAAEPAPVSVQDAPRIPWMRAEHVSGVPQWALKTELDGDVVRAALLPPGEASGDGEEKPDVPDLALFFAASRGRADPAELACLLGDVLDALAALHRAKLPGGAPSARDVALDRTARASAPIARLVRYAETPWDWMSAARDLDAFSVLLREACGSLPEGSPVAGAFGKFADAVDAGTFPTAVEAYGEWVKFVSGSGLAGEARGGAPEPPPRPKSRPVRPVGVARSTPPPEPPPRSASRRSRRRGDSSFGFLSSDSEAMRRVRAFFGAGAFLLALCAIGFGVWFYMTWSDERGRERYAQTYMADAPVVTVIPIEAAGEAPGESGATAAYRLSGPALVSAAASGEPFARARAALDALFASAPEPPSPAALAEADASMAAILPELLDTPADDAAAAFMRGVGALLALGRPSEPPVAWRELEAAADAGFPLAGVLFGDLVCGGASGAAPAAAPKGALPADSAARDRRAIGYYRAAADSLGGTPALRAAAIDRIVGLLRRAPKNPPAKFVEEMRPVVRAAAVDGSVPAMSLMALGGNFGATNAVEALDWLRRVNRSSAATPAVKAWAQTRMAARFARGVGTPASESAARVWYERAAMLGNGTAMRRWADYLESGKGDANGLGNPHAAAEWRAKAEEAAPEPDFQPAWWPVSRPEPKGK